VWWIRQAILQAIADQSRIVRLPLNQVGTINKIKKEIARLEQDMQRPPTIEELSEALDLPEYKISEIMKMNTYTQSIDSPIAPDEDTKFLDTFIYPNDDDTDIHLINESLAVEIQDVLSSLSEKERDIIKLFYGINSTHEYTLDEIGDKYDLSRERVRQIKERALKRLRQTCTRQEARNENLKMYL
jgi:RNA polymerase primary sigma factor